MIRIILSPLHRAIQWFKKTRTRNKIFTILGSIILVFIVVSQFARSQAKPPYTTETVERADITQVVAQTGQVHTNGRVDLYSVTNGIIQELYVQNMTQVVEGQELFKVSSTATEQEQASARANYLTAKASLESAQATALGLRSIMYTKWDTFVNLATNDTYENGDDTPNEKNREKAEFQSADDNWKKAEADYKNQQTVVTQAQAAVNNTWLLYQATQTTVVKAPTDGTVTNLSASVGDSVAIAPTALSASTSVPVLTLANLTHVTIRIEVNEVDIPKLTSGQSASIEFDAFPGKLYSGNVSRVDSVGTNKSGVIRYNVYIDVVDPTAEILPGMTASTKVHVASAQNVLSVPNSAVRPYKGGKAVRYYNTKTRAIDYLPVQTGLKGEERTEILQGVTEGQEIIVSLSNDQIKRPGLF